jgi:hypothetical protein
MNRILVAFLAAVLVSGCNNSPQGGSPGTNDSFKISAPAVPTVVKQGEKETVTMSLDRKSDFKKSVAVTADAPKGLKVVMNSKTITSSDPADFSFTVEADKSAPVGDHTVRVTGTPESGTATVVEVKVKVLEGPKS